MIKPEWHRQIDVVLTEKVPSFDITQFELRQLVVDYIAEIETSLTNDICMCEWIIHPDDWVLDLDVCRTCNQSRIAHRDENVDHHFVGRRMRRGEQHPECPVHTKEGFLLGFFEWMNKP